LYYGLSNADQKLVVSLMNKLLSRKYD